MACCRWTRGHAEAHGAGRQKCVRLLTVPVGSSYRSAHCQACYEAPFWCSVTGVPSARIKLACVVFPKATRVCGAASFAPRRIRQRHRW